MTTATERTRTALVTHAGTQALVGNGDSPETYRVYSLVIPQDDTMPAVVMQKIAQTRENTLADAGGSGVDNTRMQITCYATTLGGAEALAEQVRQALAAAEATDYAAIPVFSHDFFDDDSHLYRVVTDYSIWYRH